MPLDTPDFGAGDIVLLEGELTSVRHEAFDTFFASDVLSDTLFTLDADRAELLAEGEPDFILSVQLSVSRLFYEHMDEDTSVIARALVIGDKRGIDDLLYEDVQASGLAHVLSVSGLHITALATAVYWVFRKLGINAKIAYVVVLALSLFYVALVRFRPSRRALAGHDGGVQLRLRVRLQARRALRAFGCGSRDNAFQSLLAHARGLPALRLLAAGHNAVLPIPSNSS